MKKMTLLAAVSAASAILLATTTTQSASADTTPSTTQTSTVQPSESLNFLSMLLGLDPSQLSQQNNIATVVPSQDGKSVDFKLDEAAGQKAVERVQQLQQAQETVSAATPKIDVQIPSISEALQTLIGRESGGNVNASNGDYFGIGQLSSYLRSVYGGNSTDYNDQLKAMEAYIHDRYGSDENALAHHDAYGWY